MVGTANANDCTVCQLEGVQYRYEGRNRPASIYKLSSGSASTKEDLVGARDKYAGSAFIFKILFQFTSIRNSWRPSAIQVGGDEAISKSSLVFASIKNAGRPIAIQSRL
jgi:hypothetical protein